MTFGESLERNARLAQPRSVTFGGRLVRNARRTASSVPQECPTRVSYKSVLQECPTERPTRVSYKCVLQECPTRVSHKSVL